MQKKLPIKDGEPKIETNEVAKEVAKEIANNNEVLESKQSNVLDNQQEAFFKAIKDLEDKHNADILSYYGPIDISGLQHIRALTKYPCKERVILVLLTFGGDLHSAYKIAKRLQKKYKHFTLYLPGFCKSAGTLIAIGADSIIMTDVSELGPLDVQILEKGELYLSSSLSAMEPLELIKIQSYYYFINLFNDITNISGKIPYLANLKNPGESILKSVTALTSTVIEASIAQLNLPKLGQVQRDFKIAIKYGEMLIENNRGGIKDKNLITHLCSDYPNHSFVIDSDTASKFFKKIIFPEQEEIIFEEYLLNYLDVNVKNSYKELRVEKLKGY